MNEWIYVSQHWREPSKRYGMDRHGTLALMRCTKHELTKRTKNWLQNKSMTLSRGQALTLLTMTHRVQLLYLSCGLLACSKVPYGPQSTCTSRRRLSAMLGERSRRCFNTHSDLHSCDMRFNFTFVCVFVCFTFCIFSDVTMFSVLRRHLHFYWQLLVSCDVVVRLCYLNCILMCRMSNRLLSYLINK